MYGDGFANLDKINQFFADIATDPNHDPDELCHLRSVAEENDVYSGAITNEYEVHNMLSSVKKTSPGVDNIPYWVFKHCAVELLSRTLSTPSSVRVLPTYVAQGACHTCT